MASKKKANGGDLTTQILVQIRDEMRSTREDLRTEMRSMREDLHRLEQRQTEDAVRLATEVVAVARAIGDVRDLVTPASASAAW